MFMRFLNIPTRRHAYKQVYVFDLNFPHPYTGSGKRLEQTLNDCCEYVVVRFCGKAPFADR